MGDIVQIHAGTELDGVGHLLFRRIVRAEHDIAARDAQSLCEHELCLARAVDAEAILMEHADEDRIGRCLDCEELLVGRIPREGILDALGAVPDPFLIVDIERCRIALRYLLELLLRREGMFGLHAAPPWMPDVAIDMHLQSYTHPIIGSGARMLPSL